MKMTIEIDEKLLVGKMKEAAEKVRLTGVNQQGLEALARETYILLSPQREEFKAGDDIVWRHTYNRKDYPWPKGVVLYWNETQTRVKIKYINTLFDNPIGAEVESWVYPRDLIHIADYEEPETEPEEPERIQADADGNVPEPDDEPDLEEIEPSIAADAEEDTRQVAE